MVKTVRVVSNETFQGFGPLDKNIRIEKLKTKQDAYDYILELSNGVNILIEYDPNYIELMSYLIGRLPLRNLDKIKCEDLEGYYSSVGIDILMVMGG